jgi:hypothetical protein
MVSLGAPDRHTEPEPQFSTSRISLLLESCSNPSSSPDRRPQGDRRNTRRRALSAPAHARRCLSTRANVSARPDIARRSKLSKLSKSVPMRFTAPSRGEKKPRSGRTPAGVFIPWEACGAFAFRRPPGSCPKLYVTLSPAARRVQPYPLETSEPTVR